MPASPPSDPLTINLLVAEELQAAPGTPISRYGRQPSLAMEPLRSDICKAIDSSPRPINKKAVVRDLETILAQEVHLGYLNKVTTSKASKLEWGDKAVLGR